MFKKDPNAFEIKWQFNQTYRYFKCFSYYNLLERWAIDLYLLFMYIFLKVSSQLPLEKDVKINIGCKVSTSPSVVMTHVCSADFDQVNIYIYI